MNGKQKGKFNATVNKTGNYYFCLHNQSPEEMRVNFNFEQPRTGDEFISVENINSLNYEDILGCTFEEYKKYFIERKQYV